MCSTLLRALAAGLGLLCLMSQAALAQGAPAGGLAQALSAARARGCNGRPGIAAPLREVPALNQAARRVAQGAALQEATRASGYRANRIVSVSLGGYSGNGAVVEAVAGGHCAALADPALGDVGLYSQGNSQWILLAAPFSPPAVAQTGDVSAQVLSLVNRARAQPRQCGRQAFAAAGPLRLNPALERAAARHAQDMVRHSSLEHPGSDGSTPADRASQAGYNWRSVGENIASGQQSARDVVQGWLKSPEHCANIMEPGFAEMGVAFAVNPNSEGGIYWAQVFGRPR